MTNTSPSSSSSKAADDASTAPASPPMPGWAQAAVLGAILLGLVLGAGFGLGTIRGRAASAIDGRSPRRRRKAVGRQRAEELRPRTSTIEGAQPGVVHVEVRDGEVAAAVTARRPRAAAVAAPGTSGPMPERCCRNDRRRAAISPRLARTRNGPPPPAAKVRPPCRVRPHPTATPPRFHRIVFGGGPEVYWRVTAFEPK